MDQDLDAEEWDKKLYLTIIAVMMHKLELSPMTLTREEIESCEGSFITVTEQENVSLLITCDRKQ